MQYLYCAVAPSSVHCTSELDHNDRIHRHLFTTRWRLRNCFPQGDPEMQVKCEKMAISVPNMWLSLKLEAYLLSKLIETRV